MKCKSFVIPLPTHLITVGVPPAFCSNLAATHAAASQRTRPKMPMNPKDYDMKKMEVYPVAPCAKCFFVAFGCGTPFVSRSPPLQILTTAAVIAIYFE